MPLLQLLRLLLVPLLYLLLSRIISMLLGQALMFLILLLLEFLPFLFLLREYLFLLLLVFLVQLRVACTKSAGSRRGRKVARMDGRAGSSNVVVVPRTRLISATICATIGRRCIGCPRRFRRNDGAVVEYSRPRCGRDRRLAHVDGSPLLRIGSRRLRMLSLNRDRRNMSLTRRSLFLRRWAPGDSAL